MRIYDWLNKYLLGTLGEKDQIRIVYPPAIAKTIGFDLKEFGIGIAKLVMKADPARHGNPMGTIHGGVLCDLADAAIGTAHSTQLAEDESFTSIDLTIKFFRPVWADTLTAFARVTHLGKSISYYTCDITRADGKLVAVVTSSVMTLRGAQSAGR